VTVTAIRYQATESTTRTTRRGRDRRPRPHPGQDRGDDAPGDEQVAGEQTDEEVDQRTRTWEESTDPDKDAKLDRIEEVTLKFPDRGFRILIWLYSDET
jgi:hypothetical protein